MLSTRGGVLQQTTESSELAWAGKIDKQLAKEESKGLDSTPAARDFHEGCTAPGHLCALYCGHQADRAHCVLESESLSHH